MSDRVDSFVRLHHLYLSVVPNKVPIVTPISLMSKLRLTEANSPTQNHINPVESGASSILGTPEAEIRRMAI
jgi:hypothetical protein